MLAPQPSPAPRPRLAPASALVVLVALAALAAPSCGGDALTATCTPGCGDHGHCVEAPGADRCACDPGFTGATCEVVAGPCTPSPCEHGAACAVDGAVAVCDCPPGWAGATCAVADPCSPNPCMHGGTCAAGEDGLASCTCAAGWDGIACAELAPCTPNPCENGGTCSDAGGAPSCACLAGWKGDTCGTADPCAGEPCDNGGICSDDGGAAHCACPPGWAGPTCAADDPCLPNPCQHGGTCDNGTGAAVCACTTGWRGATCGDADPCSPNPCENDGGCSVVGGAIACACADGWLGPRCADPDPCVPNPCLHGGACANDGGAAACSCASGWMGPQCDEADPCEPDPCENDGVCSLVGGAPRCDCVTGWLGPTCADDDPCLPNPCANGGTCAADAGGVTSCACTPAWTGPDCTELRGGGSCDGGCDDGNFCTDDACDTATNTCTHVPSAAICAPPVTITNFTGLAGEVAFDGVGAIASDALSLNGGTGQTARARLLQPLAAGDDFVVTFGFQFSSASTAGGDGMSLVLEGSASAPLHGLMGGDDAVALAIRSGTSGADGGGSALVRLSAGGSVRGVYDASGDVTGGDFSNAGPHVVELRVVGGMATVALDDEVVIGPVTLDAAAAGAVDGSGRTWAAFVGVTGANAETHAVRSFSWTALCDTGVTCATTPTDYCDADVVCGYASASAKTCAQLGWSDGATWGSASVCARSAPGASCSGAVSWSAAVAFCEAAGARLCSVEELRADEARDSGCAYDDARVWSSTACGAMARTTLAGATTGVGNVAEACTGEGEATTAVARCCADTSPFARGVPSCDAAGCIEACAPDGCSGDPGGEPVSCVVEGDCAGACGPDAMGCTCITTPQQTKVCAPTCDTATDCPPGGPSGGWACTPMHFCVPAGGGPGGPGGPGGGGPGGGG